MSTPFRSFSFAKSRAERSMIDTVKIEFNAGGTDDDAFDMVTLAPGAPVMTLLYQGKAHVNRRGRDLLPRRFEEGEQNLSKVDCILSLPLGTPPLPQGAIVTVLASTLSPNLVGRTLRLGDPRLETFEVEYQYDVELRDDAG